MPQCIDLGDCSGNHQYHWLLYAKLFDDPFEFGRGWPPQMAIGSDVYDMGGTPLMADAIIGLTQTKKCSARK